MKRLTLTTTFVVLAATFATPGFSSDQKIDHVKQPVPAITFINSAKKKSPYVAPAIYRTDASAEQERAKNLLIDVSSKRFKKKFFKKRSFGHHRRGFGHRGFGHSRFGHGIHGHHHGGFRGHGLHKDELKKKKLIGKLLFGF